MRSPWANLACVVTAAVFTVWNPIDRTELAWGAPPPPDFPGPEEFDFDTGKAPELLGFETFEAARQISPTLGDAPTMIRFATVLSNAWFDAVAPYHPTAVGVYSELGRRPAAEATNRNVNTALFHASFHALNSFFPNNRADWRALMLALGLNPDDESADLTTPVGIGNEAGKAVVAARENDGMNQLGNEGGRKFHRQPYADYTGFEPANTAYEFKNPSKWQPNIVTDRLGIFRVQQFVTPQLRLTEPYSYRKGRRFRAPAPTASQVRNYSAYVAQVNEVLQASANLTDEQKLTAELFDNKILSLGVVSFFAASSKGLNLIETVQYDFLNNMAAFDGLIATWGEKFRYNAPRPFSAIRYVHEGRKIRAWGGPGRGTVTMAAEEFRSYTPTGDHPEYPSGSATFCGAFAEVGRLRFASDQLDWRVEQPQGCSVFDPGVVPAVDTTLVFPTWTEFENRCARSRLWGGVHFPAAGDAGKQIGHEVAREAYEFWQRKLRGERNPPRD